MGVKKFWELLNIDSRRSNQLLRPDLLVQIHGPRRGAGGHVSGEHTGKSTYYIVLRADEKTCGLLINLRLIFF